MTLPRKPLSDLRQLSICAVVDNMERFMIPYYENWDDITDENRPTFGPFNVLVSYFLILIIDELLKREETTYERLKVLLPEDTETLKCDENTRFSPFGCNTIKLISKRCPEFEMLHYHAEFLRGNNCISLTNMVLAESIQRLEYLREINFYDTWISDETIRNIAFYCPRLRVLNMHQTNLSENDVNYLLDEQSVVKHSLEKVIIDETLVPTRSVEECLLRLTNVTHFQSDQTINAALQLFNRFRDSAEASDLVSEFKTTICKNKFLETNESLMDRDFINWLGKKFPKVNHLNISLKFCEMFVGLLITSWKHITHLELSAVEEIDPVPYLEPAILSCSNLVTLKLEKFRYVDVTCFGKDLKKLEKLILIDNTFMRSEEIEFENLKELQIILFQENFDSYFLRVNSESLHIRYRVLLLMLASKNIEKILIYDQKYFLNCLINTLLEEGHLRNLKVLKVFKCRLDMQNIWDLFSRRIPVKEIVVGFCSYISDEDVNQVSNYCKENNLATSITHALENPYYLRWLVQESKVPS